MSIIRRLFIVLIASLLAPAPGFAQTASPAAPQEVHYQTIINPDREPPLDTLFGDLYLRIAPNGAISGTYRPYYGIAPGPPLAVYGTRAGNSINFTLMLEAVLTVSGFVNGDRFEGTASDGQHSVDFRAVALP